MQRKCLGCVSVQHFTVTTDQSAAFYQEVTVAGCCGKSVEPAAADKLMKNNGSLCVQSVRICVCVCVSVTSSKLSSL